MAGVYYTTRGPLNGRCGHSHNNIAEALRCLAEDASRCESKGGRSDRGVFAVVRGAWRELTEAELEAVAELRGIERR
jgi:hypothetical protein